VKEDGGEIKEDIDSGGTSFSAWTSESGNNDKLAAKKISLYLEFVAFCHPLHSNDLRRQKF
jgi:hypothetical protein